METEVRVYNQLDVGSCAVSARNEMWDLEVLVRDSGIGVVFAGYSSKNRDCW